jgi:GT2 family glycosyltransferase
VLDCLVRNTSMIFFYDQMRPHEWYNYRHAWNLNLSIPRRHFAVEQFDERLGPFFYEDLELAYRLQERHGLRVWYAPEAAALHDHRYTLEGYFAREHAMGRAVVHLWECNADCYRATYGGDLEEACLEFCRRFVESEGRRGAELFDRLQQMVTRRPDELAPTPLVRHELIRLIYDAHLPLKRLAFRRGLLEASGVPIA